MTPTMTATQPVESAQLSDEAILGIEPESGSAANGPSSQDVANAIDAEFASSGLSEMRDETRGATRPEEQRADERRADEQRTHDAEAEAPRRDAEAKPAERDANAERTLPLNSLQEFDAGFYSGDAASRTALAQSLFTSDPTAFRAMFDEAARLLGVTASPRDARNGDVRDAASREPSRTLVQNDRQRNAPGRNDRDAGDLDARRADQADRGARESSRDAAEEQIPRQTSPRNDNAANAAANAPNAANAAARNSNENSANATAINSTANAPRAETALAFPAESYRAFESATNEAVARDVRGAITRTLEQVLPQDVAEGAAKRIGEDIFGEVGKLLAADAQLSSQVGETLRGWRFGSAEQQQVASLLSGRARQILPSVARRVIGEWTNSVLSTARTRATRSEAAARRVDVGGAASGDAAGRGAPRAMRPREIDYARTSDDDIFAM